MNEFTAVERSRTIRWDNPAATAAKGVTMAGIDYLRAIAAGDISPPPFAVLLDFSLDSIEPGRVAFSCAPQEFHCNPMGNVHGGIAATLIDSAAGCAVHSLLDVGEFFGTVNLDVNYVKPIRPGGDRLVCTGEVIHRGGSIVTAEARVTGPDRTLYAYGHATNKVLRPGR